MIWRCWKNHSAKNVDKTVKQSNHRVAIVTDDPGWHGRQLKEALASHQYDAEYVSLSDASIQLTKDKTMPVLPGFEHELPAGVFIRGVSGGTLEQVIFRLNVLHLYQALNVVVYNNGRAIERTVDKCMTSFLLKQAAISSPDTWVLESSDQASQLYRTTAAAGQKLVLKPLFGSQGVGVQLLDKDPAQLAYSDHNGLYYLQTFLERKNRHWEDIRVMVINGESIAAMLRRGDNWITNRTQGASCHAIELDSLVAKTAEAAVEAVDIDYAGVDLIVDADGQLQVLEVNSIPAWWGLQKVSKHNIAFMLIDKFIQKIKNNHKDKKLI